MAIPCPECGRQYDVTLFEFGRTIACACGARVGREIRQRPLSGEPRFACDAMLGRTARWLRALGYDTAWEADVADADLVRRAVAERRILVTKDRRLPEEWRIGGVLVLETEGPVEALREIDRRIGLGWPRELFTRCLECNEPLEPASAEEVARKAPPRVRAAHDDFRRCPSCERVYWPGSHVRRLRRRLAEALAGR